jgi:hypothetical protein
MIAIIANAFIVGTWEDRQSPSKRRKPIISKGKMLELKSSTPYFHPTSVAAPVKEVNNTPIRIKPHFKELLKTHVPALDMTMLDN